MIGIWALGAYLTVILLWTTLVKRSVGEAMILGFLVVLPVHRCRCGPDRMDGTVLGRHRRDRLRNHGLRLYGIPVG